MASMSSTSLALAASTMRRACSALRAKGFSHSTCLPCSMHRMLSGQCREWGVAT